MYSTLLKYCFSQHDIISHEFRSFVYYQNLKRQPSTNKRVVQELLEIAKHSGKGNIIDAIKFIVIRKKSVHWLGLTLHYENHCRILVNNL